MSTLKVGTIQDHANSNTAISIASDGRNSFPSKDQRFKRVHTRQLYLVMKFLLHIPSMQPNT